MKKSRITLPTAFVFITCMLATLALAQGGPPDPGLPMQPPDASPRELRVLGGRTDYSVVKPEKASPQELPTWRIPNVPQSAEAYYAPTIITSLRRRRTRTPCARRGATAAR